MTLRRYFLFAKWMQYASILCNSWQDADFSVLVYYSFNKIKMMTSYCCCVSARSNWPHLYMSGSNLLENRFYWPNTCWELQRFNGKWHCSIHNKCKSQKGFFPHTLARQWCWNDCAAVLMLMGTCSSYHQHMIATTRGAVIVMVSVLQSLINQAQAASSMLPPTHDMPPMATIKDLLAASTHSRTAGEVVDCSS